MLCRRLYVFVAALADRLDISTRDQQFSRERNVGGLFRDFHRNSNCHIEKVYTLNLEIKREIQTLEFNISLHTFFTMTNKKNSPRSQ